MLWFYFRSQKVLSCLQSFAHNDLPKSPVAPHGFLAISSTSNLQPIEVLPWRYCSGAFVLLTQEGVFPSLLLTHFT